MPVASVPPGSGGSRRIMRFEHRGLVRIDIRIHGVGIVHRIQYRMPRSGTHCLEQHIAVRHIVKLSHLILSCPLWIASLIVIDRMRAPYIFLNWSRRNTIQKNHQACRRSDRQNQNQKVTKKSFPGLFHFAFSSIVHRLNRHAEELFYIHETHQRSGIA